jgi:hypothetical protein
MRSLEAPASDPFELRFDATMREGRPLLVGPSCRVVQVGPLLVAGRCEAPELASAVRWISRFALGLATVLTGLVAIGAIPRLFLLIALGWFAPALAARLIVRRRLEALGRYVLDLDAGRLAHRSGSGRDRSLDTAELHVRVEARQGELWLMASFPGGNDISLGRGELDDVRRYATTLRRQRLPVDVGPLDEPT